jgi:hypothetical protein
LLHNPHLQLDTHTDHRPAIIDHGIGFKQPSGTQSPNRTANAFGAAFELTGQLGPCTGPTQSR